MSCSDSHIRVIFVVPNDFKSKNDLSPVMLETFTTCKLTGLESVLIKENEDMQLETVKTDFVVFEQFEGDLYKTVMRSKSVRILAPLCLLHCVQTGTRIPNSDIPLVSLAMLDCVVVCSCLPKESKRDLKNKVQAMSGIFSLHLVSGTTHLITNGVKSEKYNAAVKLGIKIMTVEFIDDLWESSKTSGSIRASNSKFEQYKCPVFLNLNVCSTGFVKGESQIPALIVEHGGNFNSTMDVQKTDILVCKGSASLKYKSAQKFKIDCVTEDWVYASIEKGYALPNFKDYAVKVSTSTPTKQNEFIEPDLSQISMIGKPMHSTTTFQKEIEETLDQSCFLRTNANSTMLTNKRKSSPSGDDNCVIDTMDIKKAKLCGLYLDGCVVYIAGFKQEHNAKLCKFINFSGAVRCDTLNDTITHAIIGNLKCHDLKQIKNKDLPCAIVNVKWLIDSMQNQKPLDVDNYLIATSSYDSPKSVSSSPMSKKGLNLLRSNVTLVEDIEDLPTKLPAELESHGDEDLMKHYKNSMNTRNSVDDALAAFSLNPAMEQKSSLEQTVNKSNATITTMQNMSVNRTANNSTGASISATLEESTTPIFSGLKFTIVNYSQEEEDFIADLIRQKQGKVVSKSFKGIPDYAIVPLGNESFLGLATNVVTHLWLSACCDQRRLITELEYYHHPFSHSSSILEGLVISLGGFNKTEKEFLDHVVVRLGGKQQDSLSRLLNEAKNVLASTHLIASEATGKKYQGALKWGIPVVDKQWLFVCAEEQRLVEEFEFLIGESKERKAKERLDSASKTCHGKDSSSFKTPHRVSSLSGFSSGSKSSERFAKQSPQAPKLDISVHKEVFTPKRTDNGAAGTPGALINVWKEDEAGCATPPNGNWDGPVSSQVTPANEIMKRVREMCGGMSTPREYNPNSSLNDIKTPDSPLGICFEPNPSPATRKMWARWLNKLPSKERRLSTPFSEIKRRYWSNLSLNSPSRNNGNENDINAQNSTSADPQSSTSKSKSNGNFALIRKLDFEDGNVPEKETSAYHQPSTEPKTPKCTDTQRANDHLLIERINELENIIMSSGGTRRRSSMKKLENDGGGMVPDKESQPMTVGWDENMVIGCTAQQPDNNKPKHFMLSGVDVNGRTSLIEKLEKLGATVSALSNYDPSSTHLLCEKLNRNEKLLSSMASGLKILHISYVDDSVAAGKFVNEEDYEFGNAKTVHKFKLDADSLQRARAAHYWREEIGRRGYGAFHDIRAIVVANKKEPMIRVLQAGGAMIVEASPPFEENVSATHCFLEVKNIDIKPFVPLAQQGILCVSTLYVNDFLQRTAQDINDYIVAGFNKYY